jgi:hypothetical protein
VKLTAKYQEEKEEQKLLIEAWAIAVKNYPNVLPESEALTLAKVACQKIHDLPKRSLAS